MTKSTFSPRADNSGAKAALAGFEYQIDVSVFAALQMLLIEKSASRIVLEPADDEDLEVDLAEVGVGRVQASTVANGGKLVIQVKCKNGEPWSDADLARLLKHGKRRRPASEHLIDPDTRYMLITNAALKGTARNLAVESFIEPPTDQLPREVKKALPAGSEGRIGVWAGLTEKLIGHEINDILCDLLNVPSRLRNRCRKKLREEAKLRMAGDTPGVWAKDDLVSTIREFGGRLASAPDLEAFVPPSNFARMQALFRERNAIVIRGPSGTGKTVAAMALCDRALKLGGGMDLVTLGPNNDPSAARVLRNTGPRLFFIEDPWGSYDLEKGAGSWTDQLPRLLRLARPDYQFIVTSRTDILREAKGLDALQEWSIELDGECYQSGEFSRIYDKRMDLLRPDMQSMALEFRKDVIDDLDTPLELHLFFSALQKGPDRGELPQVFLRRLLELAHRDAVQDVVVRYLNSTADAGLAAIVWVLLKSKGNFDRSQLVEIHRQLRRFGHAPKGLDRVVDRLVATGHLRQPAVTVSFAHPSVQEGFEAFIRGDWMGTEDAIVTLVSALTSMSGPHRSWGLQTSARIIAVMQGFESGVQVLADQFDASSRTAIDDWLEASMLDLNSDFGAVLNLAANVGTGASNLSELARWFLKGFKRGGDWFDNDWRPPAFDEAWYQHISSDARVHGVVDRFIRDFFINDHHVQYGRDFPRLLDRISTETTPAFLDVTSKLVGSGRDDIIGVAARGAVRDLPAYETVLVAAFNDLEEIESKRPERAEDWRQIEDGEVDTYYEDYHISAGEDLGVASGAVVEEYVRAMRQAGRWTDLAKHPHVSGLVWYWARDCGSYEEAPPLDEMTSLLEIARRVGGEDDAWDAAWGRWRPELEPLLKERILSGEGETNVRQSLARCALKASENIVRDSVTELRQTPASLVSFLFDLWKACSHSTRPKQGSNGWSALAALEPSEQEIVQAFETHDQGALVVSRSARQTLETAATECRIEVLDHIAHLLVAEGTKPTALVRRWLVEADDKELAERAATAAIALDNEALVAMALRHRRASARRVAFEYCAKSVGAPFPPELLALALDPSGYVRKAVVTALDDTPHPEHLPVLVRLIGDRWSTSDQHYSEPPAYSVARRAADAVRKYGSLPDDVCVHLVNSVQSIEDRDLARAVFAAAATCGSAAVRQLIWNIAMRADLKWTRVDALAALAASSAVETEILKEARARLPRLAPPLAIVCTRLLTYHLPLIEAVALLEEVGRSSAKKALLLVGVLAVNDRDPARARRLLELLGNDHPARNILDLNGAKLPASVLDDLGKIQLRRFVLQYLSSYIKAK
ncbi:hypothetical protein PYR67_20685 [Rhizobium sp. BC49]|uniref:nSTAND3 domain-containing NTPase n=1 Tax=Rhizobium sp. BC49 TaxID=3031127 RepID=UPI0023D82E9E|nr:hypothetical protein [Rhizobium sp. BC49]MDF0661739.1 hypothetical protein [Rhizobium sp. BC49]